MAAKQSSQMATYGGGGALYLVVIQVTSRALTFLGNQFLLRYLSPVLLGLAVQLELLSVTILYFSRESLRVALQRQPTQQEMHQHRGSRAQQTVNLAYLAISVGLCASVGFGYGYLQRSSSQVLESVNFGLAFQLYSIATVIELIAEPCFVVIQQHALYKARARAETTAAMARCLAACLAALVMSRSHRVASVLPFAIGQLSYAAALLIMYLYGVFPVARSEGFSLAPRRIGPDAVKKGSPQPWLGLFSIPVLSLVATFYAQSIFKLLLTQGDSLILSFLTDLESQGAFALASNYGGLLSRLVFQPVEESSRNVFGRLVSSSESDNTADKDAATSAAAATNASITSNSTHAGDLQTDGQHIDSDRSNSVEIDRPSSTTTTTTTTTIDRDTPNPRPTLTATQSDLDGALAHLTTTLHLYTLSSLPVLTLLPPLLDPLTNFVLPRQWRDNPETTALLGAYVWYLPFLALNGVLDAFVTSVATPAQLRSQSLIMALITGLYGVVAWVLMASDGGQAAVVRTWVFGAHRTEPWGSPGLVYANMVNMALRIAYAVWCVGGWVRVRRRSQSELWKRSVPATGCVVVAVALGVGLRTVVSDESASLSSKRFVGIQGLSLEHLSYVLAAAVVLGSTM